jgi:predicted dinucleotide-binding enzyme
MPGCALRSRFTQGAAIPHREAVEMAVQLVHDAGCEPLVVGDLAAARSFQRHGPGFRANTSLLRLRRALGLVDDA